ncbi:ANTAGONIST OF LIKE HETEROCHROMATIN PROTEIN 1-like protein [Drosera capensis]
MAPARKPTKDSKKKKTKVLNVVVPIEPRAVESDWWDTFWRKKSSSLGAAIPSDEEEGFRYFFRMSKKTLEYICSIVREDLISRPPSSLINIEGRLLSVEKQVAIALRRLASGDSQDSVGASFGVGQSTVSQVTWRFIESLEEHAKHHLKWPDSDRTEEIKSSFQAFFGLPNCLGAIGATHITISLPAVQISDEWRGHAKNYSMLLKGIFDNEMRFLDAVTGWPGCMSVYRMLRCSGFYKLCENGSRLRGKSADALHRYAHEATTSLASKLFCRLKGSWRILSKVMWQPDTQNLPSIIVACCLLHNIILDCGDELLADVALPENHDRRANLMQIVVISDFQLRKFTIAN